MKSIKLSLGDISFDELLNIFNTHHFSPILAQIFVIFKRMFKRIFFLNCFPSPQHCRTSQATKKCGIITELSDVVTTFKND